MEFVRAGFIGILFKVSDIWLSEFSPFWLSASYAGPCLQIKNTDLFFGLDANRCSLLKMLFCNTFPVICSEWRSR